MMSSFTRKDVLVAAELGITIPTYASLLVEHMLITGEIEYRLCLTEKGKKELEKETTPSTP